MSNIVLNTNNIDPVEEKKDFNIFIVISIVELVVIAVLVMLFFKNKKSNSKVDSSIIEESVISQEVEASQEVVVEVGSQENTDNIVSEESSEVFEENTQNESDEETP